MVHAPEVTIARAGELRRRLSLPEVLLWRVLKPRSGGFKWRRQHPRGRYVLDFYCHELRLAVEIDGRDHEGPARLRHDAVRDAWLESTGVRVVRIPAVEVLRDLDGVLEGLLQTCRDRAGPLHRAARGPPLPTGEDF